MAGSKISVDIKALSKAAQAELSGAVASKAAAIQAAAQSQLPPDVPVGVQMTENAMGAPVAIVTITHASGLPRQAKDGVLTRAAASSGLDVSRG